MPARPSALSTCILVQRPGPAWLCRRDREVRNLEFEEISKTLCGTEFSKSVWAMESRRWFVSFEISWRYKTLANEPKAEEKEEEWISLSQFLLMQSFIAASCHRFQSPRLSLGSSKTALAYGSDLSKLQILWWTSRPRRSQQEIVNELYSRYPSTLRIDCVLKSYCVPSEHR